MPRSEPTMAASAAIYRCARCGKARAQLTGPGRPRRYCPECAEERAREIRRHYCEQWRRGLKGGK